MSPQLATAMSGDYKPAAPSLPTQLGIVAEMLAALETQTTAGQRHTMGKVVGILAPHVGRRASVRLRMARTIDELAHEAGRLVPDAPLFRHHAELVVFALRAIA
jgi:hypothetical protein